MERLAPQIEVAVGETDLLRIVGLAEHGQREFRGLGEHIGAAHPHLDLAGGQVRVHRLRRPGHDLTVDAHHALRAQGVERLEAGIAGMGDELCQAVVIAKVDEQQAAVITLAVDPAGKAHGPAGVGEAQLAAGVGAIGVHGGSPGRRGSESF